MLESRSSLASRYSYPAPSRKFPANLANRARFISD